MSGLTADGRIETVRVVPKHSAVSNYGFDVTPARLVTGLITERGVVAPSQRGPGRRLSGARRSAAGRTAGDNERISCNAPSSMASPVHGLVFPTESGSIFQPEYVACVNLNCVPYPACRCREFLP